MHSTSRHTIIKIRNAIPVKMAQTVIVITNEDIKVPSLLIMQLIEDRIKLMNRLEAREKLKESEKVFM